MAKRDYYEVLGLQRGASKEDIKKAYRKVAVANHPDRNPGDKQAEERFKEATEAYEVLADDQKRQAYDQFGFAGVEGMGAQGGYSHAFHDFEDIFGGFSDIFESIFGGGFGAGFGGTRGRRGSRVRAGADLRYDMEISFEEAVFGAKKEVTYKRHVHCDRCNGTGAEGGGGRKTCPTCGGVGQVRRSQGFFSIASTCPTCGGEGQVIENPCSKCDGTGLLKKERTVKVTIPPGIDSGKRISLRGEGDAGPNGGPAGDLYVVVRVRPHEYFERQGHDLYFMIPIPLTQAALGAEVQVPTLDGKRVKLGIPAGTQNEKLFRLKNLGVPHLRDSSKRGDLYVKIHIEVPRKLSGKAKKLLRELSEAQGENDTPDPVPLSRLK
ncbi:MAG: molecular chaperone DnaJ [Spirochaetaceae bacterium]